MLKSCEQMARKVLEKRDAQLRRRRQRALWAAPAAVCLLLAVGFAVLNRMGAFSMAVWNEEDLRGPAGPVDAASEYDEREENEQVSSPAASVGEAEGIVVPAIEPPTDDGSAAADMIGMLVYRGHVYTQDQFFEDGEGDRFIGEYLGKASGTINCFSPPEEHPEGFASTYDGEVYTVNGYDPDFRLCVVNELKNEDGTLARRFVVFLNHLNGIVLRTGADLFGPERLNLSGRIVDARWQSHEDWDQGLSNLRELSLEDGLWEAFMEGLFAGDFQDAWAEDPDVFIDPERRQLHLYLGLKDGSTVELRLWDDGYAALQGFGWYRVRVGKEAILPIFEACQ